MITISLRPPIERPSRTRALAAAISLAIAGRALSQENTPPVLEEVIVTATMRNQNLLDVPYNISAVTADQIKNSGVTDLEGITRMVPGLSAPDLGPRGNSSGNFLVIRGLNTTSIGGLAPRLQQSTVSTYVDETPMFVNLKIADINRVEILRGPQGTLYGSSSVGGTVRLIYNKPSTEGAQADFSTKVSTTAYSGKPSYSFDGVGNLPLGGNLALRVSAGYEKLGGFIDADSAVVFDRPLSLGNGAQPVLANPQDPLNSGLTFRKIKDIDDATTWYARSALLWKVTDNFEALATYHHQHDWSGGFSAERPGSNYVTSKYIPQEVLDRDVDLLSLTLTGTFGFATITSSSSYYTNNYDDLWDLTFLGERLANSVYYGFYPRPTQTNYDFSREHAFAEEIRLVSKDTGKPWDWVVGAFYRQYKNSLSDPETMPGFSAWADLPGSAAAANAALGTSYTTFGDVVEFYNVGVRPSKLQPTDFIYNFNRTLKFKDTAAFGEASYHFNKAWQVTGGARLFRQEYSQQILQELPICGVFCSESFDPSTFTGDPYGRSTGTAAQSIRSEVFKANTSYHFNEASLGYLTWSQGFRPGGANAFAIGPCPYCEPNGQLISYSPDKATNYEVGIKGHWGRWLQYSSALYRIDWQHIQLERSDQFTGTTIIFNGATARSQGVELELQVQPTERFKATVGFTSINAKLTEGFVVGNFTGKDGDRLPGAPKTQISGTLEFIQPISSGTNLRFHLDGAYRGSVAAGLNDTEVLSPFTVLNGSIGMNLGKAFGIRAFAENLTNVKGVTDLKSTAFALHNHQEFVTRPRTIGIAVTYKMR